MFFSLEAVNDYSAFHPHDTITYFDEFTVSLADALTTGKPVRVVRCTTPTAALFKSCFY